METGPALVLVRGARQAEERLLAEIAAALASGRGDLTLLARPLRVVVPSRRLREHLCAALVRQAGRSLAGVEVLTHLTLALRLLERAGEAPPRGEAFFALAVRRCARQEAVLCDRLDGLEDGYGVVEAAVRDLLDAGLDPDGHAEALDEFLSETAGDAAGVRARAVLRVATRTAAELARLGFGGHSTLLRRATQCLARQGPEGIPTRALWIHGFPDATGVVADWLEMLQRRLGARTILSQPPAPGEAAAWEEEFSARLRQRLAAAAREERPEPSAPEAPMLQVLRAPGATAELRAVAARIRGLLDAGARPEGIAIVARNLEPYRAGLREQLEQRAVPFSAPSLRTPGGPAARHAEALLELLARGERIPVDRWLDAHARDPGADLRTAFHAIGAGRLEDLSRLDVGARLGEADVFWLPVRSGLASEDDDAENGPDVRQARRRVARRRIPRRVLERWHARAARSARRLQSLARRAPVELHGQGLRRLLRSLGWPARDEAWQPVFAAIGQLEASLAGAPELAFDEWVLLLRRSLAPAVGIPVGGAGGGVQVLSVMEARGLPFDHLFVIGLNRDVFPRPVGEDALIPDTLRLRLRSLLPDLPVKGEGHAEERHHFAELLAASPHVTLSWQELGDDGRERVASPLLVRLRLARADLPEASVPGATGSSAAGEPTPRPVLEHVLLAGLHGSRRHFGRVLRVALAESQAELDAPRDAGALAAARLAVLDELDPDLRTSRGRSLAASLGPYCGFVGAGRVPELAETPELPVTHLQKLAGCPWQAFLEWDLGLEPVPDALDALPSVDPARVGRVVHEALQALVDARLGPSPPRELAVALTREAVPIPWPDSAALERILLDAAWRVVREDGTGLEGLARLLAHRARPFLEMARRRDWQPAGGLVPVLGAELDGAFELRDAAGRRRRVGFRVDRVDRGDGRVRLSDYKTSRPFSTAATATARARNLARAVGEGRALQAPAYVEGALPLAAGLAVEGRYVFLRPDATDETGEQGVAQTDEPLRARLHEVSRTVLAARDAGALFPRLVEARRDAEPRRCEFCAVRDACLRGESAHRRRLRAWAGSRPGGVEEEPLRAFRALWWLGADAQEDA